MASKSKKRDLFMGDEYWNESEKRITPFDFEDDTEGYAFMRKFKEMQVHADPAEEDEIIGWDGKSINVSDTAAAASPVSLPASVTVTSARSPVSSPAARSVASSSTGHARSLTDGGVVSEAESEAVAVPPRAASAAGGLRAVPLLPEGALQLHRRRRPAGHARAGRGGGDGKVRGRRADEGRGPAAEEPAELPADALLVRPRPGAAGRLPAAAAGPAGAAAAGGGGGRGERGDGAAGRPLGAVHAPLLLRASLQPAGQPPGQPAGHQGEAPSDGEAVRLDGSPSAGLTAGVGRCTDAVHQQGLVQQRQAAPGGAVRGRRGGAGELRRLGRRPQSVHLLHRRHRQEGGARQEIRLLQNRRRYVRVAEGPCCTGAVPLDTEVTVGSTPVRLGRPASRDGAVEELSAAAWLAWGKGPMPDCDNPT